MSTINPWGAFETGKSGKAMSLENLAKELDIPLKEISLVLKNIPHKKPERVQVPHVSPSGRQQVKFVLTYAPEDIEKIRNHFYSRIEERDTAEVNKSYFSKSQLKKSFGIGEKAFVHFLEQAMQKMLVEASGTDSLAEQDADKPWREIKKTKNVEYFSSKIRAQMEELLTHEDLMRERERGNYFTLIQVIRMLHLQGDRETRDKIKGWISELLTNEPELEAGVVKRAPNVKLPPVTHYSRQIFELLREKLEIETQERIAEMERQIPPGYIPKKELSDTTGIELQKIGVLVKNFVADNTDLVNPVVKVSRNVKNRNVPTYYYSPEVAQKIVIYNTQLQEKKAAKRAARLAWILNPDRESSRDKQQRAREVAQGQSSEEQKEMNELKERVISFFTEVEQGSTLQAVYFRKLLLIFGSSHLVDILFEFHPDFEKLPLSYTKGEIAKYLGDFLMVSSPDVMDNLEITLPFLGKESYRESLFLLIKEEGIKHYSKEKKRDKQREDTLIINDYLSILKVKQSELDNPDLDMIVTKVETYFSSLLYSFNKPMNVVDELERGRQFPDLNQLINVKEIHDQKRVLIADEMGMGKSASAILAKEYLKAGVALVVVPTNVIDTWKRFLSDYVDQNGVQRGYFKKGHAPRVLEVTTPEGLDTVTKNDFDYVLISQERLSDDYADVLKRAKFDMFIVDEVHKFKNITAGRRSQALVDFLTDLEKLETYTVLLSGTPVPNKIKDIAIIIKLLYPEEFKDVTNKELVKSIVNGDLIDLRNLLFKRMQMKKLTENIEMPNKTESTVEVALSEGEAEVYQLLLEDDDLSASEKLHILRLFCLQPELVATDANAVSSKIEKTSLDLQEIFKEKNKIILFVNGYIEGIIRGEKTIQEMMNLPKDIQILVIDGHVEREKRKEIEDELRHNKYGKILLIVSGQTADVGVDYSSAESMYFYNEPWTRYDKMQQIARTYRPGLKHDLDVRTSITKDTIEEGMHAYIEIKYKAVQKLLQGIPLSELEKMIVTLDERASSESSFDNNPSLAEDWLQSPVNTLNKFFNTTKEIGTDRFVEFLQKHGVEYAENYAEYGSRGYQANTARLVSSLITDFKRKKGILPDDDITILDLGSGPEMLANHAAEEDKKHIISLDINPHHFSKGTGAQIVGNVASLPIRNSSVDYANLSLVFHYLKAPGKEDSERLTTITEIARVLKVGGRCSIPMVPSFEFKNKKMLYELLEECGLDVIEEISGTFTHKQAFRSECITFEKREEVDITTVTEKLRRRKYLLDGLNLRKTTGVTLKNSQLVTNTFTLHGEKIQANLDNEDTLRLAEQEQIQSEGKLLIKQYGSIESIPHREILEKGFIRYHNGKRNKLVKKSKKSNSYIRIG